MSTGNLSREQWLENRRAGIGGSDAAAILGMSKFRTPLQVYLDKIGQAPETPETTEMRWGKKLEPLILEEYQELTGVEITPNVLVFHDKHPWMMGTLDAMRADRRVVEAKCVGFNRFGEWGEEGSDYVPTDYLLQVQHYLAVTGSTIADIAALFSGNTLRIYTVQADQDLIDAMTMREAEFWQRVITRNPPSPEADDASIMQFVYPHHEAEISVPQTIEPFVDEYQRLGEEIKEREEARNLRKALILEALKGASLGVLSDGRRIKQTVVNRKESVIKASTYVQMTISKPKGK